MNKYQLTKLHGKNLILNLSQLFKEEILYINATSLVKQFGKDLSNYMRSPETIAYFNALNEHSKSVNSTELELVKIERGRYGGTYIHSGEVSKIHTLFC